MDRGAGRSRMESDPKQERSKWLNHRSSVGLTWETHRIENLRRNLTSLLRLTRCSTALLQYEEQPTSFNSPTHASLCFTICISSQGSIYTPKDSVGKSSIPTWRLTLLPRLSGTSTQHNTVWNQTTCSRSTTHCRSTRGLKCWVCYLITILTSSLRGTTPTLAPNSISSSLNFTCSRMSSSNNCCCLRPVPNDSRFSSNPPKYSDRHAPHSLQESVQMRRSRLPATRTTTPTPTSCHATRAQV